MFEEMGKIGLEVHYAMEVMTASDSHGRNAFHIAAERGSHEVVEALLMWFDPDSPDLQEALASKDDKGRTRYHGFKS